MVWRRETVDQLAVQAGRELDAARVAFRVPDFEAAADHLQRCDEHSAELLQRAPERIDFVQGRASVLYDLGEIRLVESRYEAAVIALDEAEQLYSDPRLGDGSGRLIADVRARRARAHAATGASLTALQDVQSAVIHYVRLVDPRRRDEDYLSLARVLAMTGPVLADHASSRMALLTAQEACTRLVTLVNSRAIALTEQVRLYLRVALSLEVEMLRALGRDQETENALTALAKVLDPAGFEAVLRAGHRPKRFGLPDAVRVAQHSASGPNPLEFMLADPPGTACLPIFLVQHKRLLDAAGAARQLMVRLARYNPDFAAAAGRDAACMYAFAADDGLFDALDAVPARERAVTWLQLLTDLAILARDSGDVPLAKDCAQQSARPLARIDPDTLTTEQAETVRSYREVL